MLNIISSIINKKFWKLNYLKFLNNNKILQALLNKKVSTKRIYIFIA